MAIKLKPKTVGPIIVQWSGGKILYSFKDPDSMTSTPPADYPSHTLMASLGACYVVSMNRVADQIAIALPDFTIQITSTSSADLPMRIARLDVIILGLLSTDKSMSGQIVKQAKAMCTVGNTLNCEITTFLEGATINDDSANTSDAN